VRREPFAAREENFSTKHPSTSRVEKKAFGRTDLKIFRPMHGAERRSGRPDAGRLRRRAHFANRDWESLKGPSFFLFKTNQNHFFVINFFHA
jgi:hypothetical protein